MDFEGPFLPAGFFALVEELLLVDFFVVDDFLSPALLDDLPDDLVDDEGFFALVVFLVVDLVPVALDFEVDLPEVAFLVAFDLDFGFGLVSVCAIAEAVKQIASRMARRFFMVLLHLTVGFQIRVGYTTSVFTGTFANECNQVQSFA